VVGDVACSVSLFLLSFAWALGGRSKHVGWHVGEGVDVIWYVGECRIGGGEGRGGEEYVLFLILILFV
jgi:hypothetical protein